MIPARTLHTLDMLRSIASLLTMVLLLGASAQSPASVKEKARAYVNVLAGPTMHGRGYVLEGDRIAADFVTWVTREPGCR